MTRMTLKERYEMKTELSEAIDKEHLKKGVDIIKKMKSIDMTMVPAFEDLRKATVNDISKIISGGNWKDKFVSLVNKGVDPFKKVDKVAAIFSNFFSDITEYVNSLHAGNESKSIRQVIGNDEKNQKNFLRMIKKGLQDHSGLIKDPKYVINNVMNLTVDELNQLSKNVSQAFGDGSGLPQAAVPQNPEDTDKRPGDVPRGSRGGETTGDPSNAKTARNNIEKKLFNAYGVKTSSELLVKLKTNASMEQYNAIINALAKALG